MIRNKELIIEIRFIIFELIIIIFIDLFMNLCVSTLSHFSEFNDITNDTTSFDGNLIDLYGKDTFFDKAISLIFS